MSIIVATILNIVAPMILIVLPPTISNVVGEIRRDSWYLVKIPHSGAKTPFVLVKVCTLPHIYYIMSTDRVPIK